jgi:hypothetical protein
MLKKPIEIKLIAPCPLHSERAFFLSLWRILFLMLLIHPRKTRIFIPKSPYPQEPRMKRYFFLLAVLIVCLIAWPLPSPAQQAKPVSESCIPKPDMLDGQKVNRLANTLAKYPGGESKMLEFIQTNIDQSKCKSTKHIKAVLTFVVDAKGRVRNPCILHRGENKNEEMVNTELLRVFSAMPKWEPAVLLGEKAYMRLIIPVEVLLN